MQTLYCYICRLLDVFLTAGTKIALELIRKNQLRPLKREIQPSSYNEEVLIHIE